MEEISTPEGATQDEAARLQQSAEHLVGQKLAERYLIERVLGVGGMGAVYQAEHLLMHKRVAIKVLHPEMTQLTEAVQRFEREAMAAGRIEHPNVVAATDFGKLEDGSFFLVLEFVEGKSLRELMDRQESFPPERVVRIIRQILQGLTRAHSLGIVHRDLKPENVMLVQREDDPDFVKMLDFGIAKVPVAELTPPSVVGPPSSTAALTRLGMVYGTPEYMAPEQALGQEIDARADLYALGVISFEMLAGRRPFIASNPVQILGQVVSKPVPAISEVCPEREVPPAIEEIVRTLLAKSPDERYADARTALVALDTAAPPTAVVSLGQTGERVAAQAQSMPAGYGSSSASPSIPLPLWLQDRRVQLGAGGGILLLLLLTAALFHHDPQSTIANGSASASVSAASVSSAEPPAELPVSEIEIKEAREKGIDSLLELKKRAPQNPHLLLALAQTYTQQKKAEEALSSFGDLLSTEPPNDLQTEIQTSLIQLVLSEKKPDPGIAFLEQKAGSLGIDILFELSRSSKASAFVKKKAMDALNRSLEKASPALKVALNIRNAASVGPKNICSQATRLKQLFVEAKDLGDSRALLYLLPMTGSGGCSSFWGIKKQDCYACLRDGKLNEAISAIREREKSSKKLVIS